MVYTKRQDEFPVVFSYFMQMEEGGVRHMSRATKSTEPYHIDGHGERGDTCLLLIHGFTGNPGDVRWISQRLNEYGYTVRAICLPGHGTTPEQMNETRWEDWWRHTVLSFDQLRSEYPAGRIVTVGYSMGGLLALLLSLTRPTAGTVSLAAPIFLQDRRIWAAGIVKHVKKYIHKPLAISELLLTERGAYAKTPLACVHSLYKHMRMAKRVLPFVRAPLFIGQGLADGTVRPVSADYIHRMVASQHKQLIYYPDASHAILSDGAREAVYRDVLGFVDGLPRWAVAESDTDEERGTLDKLRIAKICTDWIGNLMG